MLTAVFSSPALADLLRLALIVLLALLAHWGVRLAVRQLAGRLERTIADPERVARLKTFLFAGRSLASVLVAMIAGLTALRVLDIDIGPVLAGAGLVGLALSLGAQTLIRDYIGGLLILLENQFRVGDVIQVGDKTGSVERITVRATYLRDIEGRLHLIPHGEMRILSNVTKDWARAVVDLNVAFDADFGKVIRALEAAARRAQEDETIKADLLEPPQALGWIGFKDWAVQVRIMARTRPGKQWGVMMVLRQYAVEALHAEGVKVALPTQKVIPDSSSA
ncbi:MAG: mechanosensitive ion channel [Anaerolineales bacterium]|jgi:small conductance mechanosensitive channel|nr:mechanosensitive ion channel [Anaerolineales bacterium]MBM2849475.1 mechanosensitive ion channel [Anaerolineales bacterium]